MSYPDTNDEKFQEVVKKWKMKVVVVDSNEYLVSTRQTIELIMQQTRFPKKLFEYIILLREARLYGIKEVVSIIPRNVSVDEVPKLLLDLTTCYFYFKTINCWLADASNDWLFFKLFEESEKKQNRRKTKMKALAVSSPVKPIQETEILKKNTIQGLYPFKDCHESFWSLKARIELAVFRDHKKEVNKQK